MTDHARALRDLATDEPRAAQRGIMEQAADEIERLRGAMTADDARLRAAGERVGLCYGCDTADALADEIERLRAALQAVDLNGADVLAKYAGKDGRRDWVSVGTWLHPGEVILHTDDPRLRQASGETTGYASGTAP